MAYSTLFSDIFGDLLRFDDVSFEQIIDDAMYENFLLYGNPDAEKPQGVIRLHPVRDWNELPVWML